MISEQEILDSNRCSVIAPAGCGKTELIVKCVQSSKDDKRFLVLTHTHAGVRALRSRFKRNNISSERFRIDTIAGWSLGFTSAYPVSSLVLNSTPSGNEWDQIYKGAGLLFLNPHIQKVLKQSYAGVFVDEYQDCNSEQHRLISSVAQILPCRVFGDPLQGIFGFAGAISWTGEVEAFFPTLGALDYPWRWHEKNGELGAWLIGIRERLINGESINLEGAPLNWIISDPQNQRASALSLLSHKQPVIVIRSRANQAHSFAQSIGRAYVSMEEMECKDLMTFMRDMDSLNALLRPVRIIEFAKSCITGLAPHIGNLEEAFKSGRLPSVSRIRDENKRIIAESLILSSTTNNHEHIMRIILLLEKLPETRIFREELWYEAKKTLREFIIEDGESLHTVAWQTRNKARFTDRDHGRHVVSRTLLIKGLEFDHALIPDAGDFTGSDAAKQFYVAVTRGSRSLTILSSNPVLQFPRPTI